MERSREPEGAVMAVLLALSFSHMLNDTSQSLLIGMYPVLKGSFRLTLGQVGLITLCFQIPGAVLQPIVGFYTDRRPHPYSLAVGMGSTLAGLLLLALAGSYDLILVAAALVGVGSSIFHPEASRVAKLASGGRHGFAQSLFQVGGNFGSSLGPLLAAYIIVPRGQRSVLWFSVAAFFGIFLLSKIGGWYRRHLAAPRGAPDHSHGLALSRTKVVVSVAILLALIFSKYLYLVSFSNYYTFYLIAKFGVSVRWSLIYLFIFLFAVAAGTFVGGPVGDRVGRKYVIWVSILGVAPLTLWLPYLGLEGTILLTVLIGLILSSAFSAILVYAQELIPGRTGLVAGLFFGFAFGVAGIGSARLGELADETSIFHVFKLCSFLPLIGLLTGFLPNLETKRKA